MMMVAPVRRSWTSRVRSHGRTPKRDSIVLGNQFEKNEPVGAVSQEFAEARDQHPMPAAHQA
jgi:hypothetical protein